MFHHKPYEGFFITVEGGEGAGKSTLAKGLMRKLEQKGLRPLHTREPGGTVLAEEIRKLLLHSEETISAKSELLLFLAARAQHLEELILPALHKGGVVICERFNDSTIAYQGYASHLGMENVEKYCNLVCEGAQPDITFFLDLDPEIGLKRHGQRKLDRLESKELQFHKEVRQGYLQLADRYAERICILDAQLPTEQLLDQALALILKKLKVNSDSSR